MRGAGQPRRAGGVRRGLAALAGAALAGAALVAAPTQAAAWQLDVSLANADASYLGETTQGYAARSLAGVGDVDGDGYDDLLIGEYGHDALGTRTGAAYLVLGGPTGWAMDTALSAADASFVGEAAGDGAGWSVAGAGDVDGDGLDDLLIGAYRNDENGTYAGQTYVVLGRAAGWALDTALDDADASFQGTEFDESGTSVAGVGDVNGDGYDDVLIGANANDEAGTAAGQSYLLLGEPGAWAMDTLLTFADASFRGTAQSQSGEHVAGAGDVDGDGYDDLLIAAPWDDLAHTNAGQVFLVLGQAAGWATDVALAASDASWVGEQASDLAGESIAGAGDLDGDGYDDLVIGAYGNDEAGGQPGAADGAGQAYVIFGRPSGWSTQVDLATADASFLGEATGDWAGWGVGGGGDLDGDGYDDLLIGATHSDAAWSDAGQLYVIFGGPAGWARDVPLGLADASFVGEAAGDRAGIAAAFVGDVDGDAGDDLLIGAYWSDEGATLGGQAYLVRGDPPVCHDGDGDGYGDPGEVTCPGGTVPDCDDGDAAVFPGADEWCNGADDDCDGTVDEADAVDAVAWYLDGDGDGYGETSVTATACAPPPDHVAADGDCDDGDAQVFPGADEWCNGADDDCDGVTDEPSALDADTWYADGDGDGFGDAGAPTVACAAPPGFVADASDCDDGDAAVFPGADEWCNAVDDDCDGVVDEPSALDATPWYADADGDGYGDAGVGVVACAAPPGFVIAGTDCDDGDADVHPGATEFCNGVDDDCDGAVDEGHDLDGDGYTTCAGDCDDGDADVHPGGLEICNGGVDDDCDVATDEHVDGDGDGWAICDGDCDDTRADVSPDGDEICNAGVDDDCDPATDEAGDVDGDGQSICDGDCDDDDPLTFDGAAEQCDGLDNDCDGAPAADEADGDGDGQASCAGDCDDTDPLTFDGAAEQCDGLDNDCDGDVDEGTEFDQDGDGFTSCGDATTEPDCHDGDASIYPGAVEQCDGLDGDCDGALPDDEADLDGDGWMACVGADDGGDCDDGDAALNLDDADNDGWTSCDGDCDDGDPGANRDDLDGDGWHTCDDPPDCNDVNDLVSPGTPENCLDGIDNNCDGQVDAADEACAEGDDDDDAADDDDSAAADDGAGIGCQCLQGATGGAAGATTSGGPAGGIAALALLLAVRRRRC